MGIEAFVMDAEALPFNQEFDAVFSNAVLQWIKGTVRLIASVWRELKSGGRFVAEMGGHGAVAKIVAALDAALLRRGFNADELNPWYFLTGAEYQERLERGGFGVTSIVLFPRPTPLSGNITGWLETFAESFTSALSPPERPKFIMEVQEALRPDLCVEDGQWPADYVRLRFAANKRGS